MRSGGRASLRGHLQLCHCLRCLLFFLFRTLTTLPFHFICFLPDFLLHPPPPPPRSLSSKDVKSKWDEVEAAQESASATINKRSGRQERNWKSRARNNRLSGQFGTLDALKDRYKKRGSAAGGPAGVAGAAGGGGGAGTASASTMPATALERRASAEGRKAFAEALKAQKEQQSGNDIRV